MIHALKKFALSAAWVAVVAFAVPASAQSDKTVLISLSKASEPFMALMRQEAEDEAKKLNVSVVFEDGKGDSGNQAAGVENAVARKRIDGLVIAPNNVYALVPAVNFALEKGLPVITVDRQVYGTAKKVPHVGVDNVAGGRMMAEWVTQNFPNGARILHLTGQPGSSTAIDRAKGVREGLATAGPKYQIVADMSADWSRAEALMVTEGQLTYLKTPPEVIVADNDDMAMGALEAIRLGSLGKSGIKVIGYDALPFAVAKLREGALAATVDQHGGQQIRTALRSMVEHLRTGKPLESVTLLPSLVTMGNLPSERVGETRQ